MVLSNLKVDIVTNTVELININVFNNYFEDVTITGIAPQTKGLCAVPAVS